MSSSNAAVKQNYHYSAFGLTIDSDVRLSELVPSDAGDDIRIENKKLDQAFLDEELKDSQAFERVGCTVRISPDRTLYEWKGIGKALIRKGRQVFVEPEPGIKDTDLAPFITGAIFGHLLNQRGLMVLHGSALVVNDKGTAFLGEKGAGKSTLAVHLQNRGYDLLTDDLIPLIFKENEIQTIFGYPRIRLWADSVESIGMDPGSLPQINSFFDKLSYRYSGNFSDEPVKLSRLFILTLDQKLGIERLNSQEAFIEIVKNTYLNRYLQATGQFTEHFRQCEKIVKTVPVFRLKRPHDFSELSRVAELIENFD
ncbi:MAG: hypothetical protein R2747_21130 [Pyrinomonadaceae bacterium]